MKFRTLLTAILVFFSACLNSERKSGVNTITPIEAFGLMKNNFAVIVDVREKNEVIKGMVQGAVWIPTSKIKANAKEWKDFIAQSSKDKKIVFYCAAGFRAGRAAKKMADLGFEVFNMGGFSSWKNASLPLEKPGID